MRKGRLDLGIIALVIGIILLAGAFCMYKFAPHVISFYENNRIEREAVTVVDVNEEAENSMSLLGYKLLISVDVTVRNSDGETFVVSSDLESNMKKYHSGEETAVYRFNGNFGLSEEEAIKKSTDKISGVMAVAACVFLVLPLFELVISLIRRAKQQM